MPPVFDRRFLTRIRDPETLVGVAVVIEKEHGYLITKLLTLLHQFDGLNVLRSVLPPPAFNHSHPSNLIPILLAGSGRLGFHKSEFHG
jgi:hypothetical protein